jgi:hypothetical protein
VCDALRSRAAWRRLGPRAKVGRHPRHCSRDGDRPAAPVAEARRTPDARHTPSASGADADASGVRRRPAAVVADVVGAPAARVVVPVAPCGCAAGVLAPQHELVRRQDLDGGVGGPRRNLRRRLTLRRGPGGGIAGPVWPVTVTAAVIAAAAASPRPAAGEPVGPLFCVIDGPTRGRPWCATAVRSELRLVAARAGVRRRFAPHQLRHALRLSSPARACRSTSSNASSAIPIPARPASICRASTPRRSSRRCAPAAHRRCPPPPGCGCSDSGRAWRCGSWRFAGRRARR